MGDFAEDLRRANSTFSQADFLENELLSLGNAGILLPIDQVLSKENSLITLYSSGMDDLQAHKMEHPEVLPLIALASDKLISWQRARNSPANQQATMIKAVVQGFQGGAVEGMETLNRATQKVIKGAGNAAESIASGAWGIGAGATVFLLLLAWIYWKGH